MDSYLKYGPALVRKAKRLLRNDEEALDAVQSLFLELLELERPSFDLPYLYCALTHRCLDLLRDHRRRAQLLAREQSALTAVTAIAPDVRALGLDTLCKLAEQVEAPTMETLVYRYFDEMTLEEIAELMKVSRKTVQNRLARAAEALASLKGVRS